MSAEQEADYIVVGGGTAGAVIARRLADAGESVLLFEAGPSGEHDDRVLTLSRWDELIGSELDWDVTIEAQERGNELIRHSRARVLGGCSSHNTCIAFRAPEWDLREWERLGAKGWGPEGAGRYFDRVASQVNIEDSAHDNDCASAFLDAAQQWGLPRVDFTSDVQDGAGWFKVNKRGTIRESSAVAYLFPLSDLPSNLTVVTGHEVHRVLLDAQGDAVGIEHSGGKAYAGKEVILTAGVFGSAKMLLLSGIGPQAHLSQVGVETRVDLPGVGEHLIDHPEGIVLFEATQPMAEISCHWESGFFKTLEGSDYPEVMAHFTTQKFDTNTTARGYPTGEHTFSIHPNITRARSEGVVRLRSTDPAALPAVDPRYYTDPEGYDQRIMLEGIRIAREIGNQPALAPWIKQELAPGSMIDDLERLSEYARMTGNTVYHPAGTCKMGASDDATAVVDPELRVRGVGRLRVADASVFPCMTTVNPCITVMMIGEKCSDLVLGAAA